MCSCLILDHFSYLAMEEKFSDFLFFCSVISNVYYPHLYIIATELYKSLLCIV